MQKERQLIIHVGIFWCKRFKIEILTVMMVVWKYVHMDVIYKWAPTINLDKETHQTLENLPIKTLKNLTLPLEHSI